MEYYDILGVTKDASLEQITKAFREAALKWHPDKNSNNQEAVKKFKLAAEAFEVLSDHNKRVEYDAKGYVGRRPPRKPARPKPKSKPKEPEEKVYTGPPPIAIIQMAYFGGGTTGRNIMAHVELDEEQLKKGGGYHILMKKQEICLNCFGDGIHTVACTKCRGTGKLGLLGVNFKNSGPPCYVCQGRGGLDQKCNICRGSGRNLWVNKDIRINVPPNCQPGHQITVHGEGEHSPRKMPGFLRVVCLQKTKL